MIDLFHALALLVGGVLLLAAGFGVGYVIAR